MEESSKNSEGGERGGNLAETMEGGSTSEDVMVQVLGSDVFVDGVRSHEDDGKIDAVVCEDDAHGDKNKTMEDMEIDSELPNDWSEPNGGKTKDTGLVKDVGSSETETEVHRGEKEILDEEGVVVAEASIIDLVEKTRVVVDGKKLIEEINEVEYPLEDDASTGGLVESSRPIDSSTTPVEDLDGSESAAVDTIVATVEQDTLVTTKLVHNQEDEENANVENGIECNPFLVLRTSSSLCKVNLNPQGDSDGVGQADVTEEPSLELQAPVSVEGEVKKIKEDAKRSLEVAVPDEEIQPEDKSQMENAVRRVDEADDGGVFADDLEQKTQINVSGKTKEVDEKSISSTCPIDQDSTEANMEVVTGSSEKLEHAEEAIDQKEDEETVNIVEYKEIIRIDNNHQEMESGTVTTVCDHIEVLEAALAEPVVVGVEDNSTNDQEAGSPSQSSQPTIGIEQREALEENVTNAKSDHVLSEHILCESTEMDVQVMEHGECVVTVDEVVLSCSNDAIQVAVVENSSEYMDRNLFVNLPIDVDSEQPATNIDEKQLADEAEVVEIETRVDTIFTKEEKVPGEEHGTANYGEQNDLKTETTFAGYNLPQEKEDGFTVTDLVWGKVSSHLWWPGQIFDPSAASETALQYHEEDSYLVAYFGDQTFTWMNEASGLKPLKNHFSQLVKQSSSEAFQNAVECALEEVSRRAQLSLTCSCILQDERINFQIVENDGINLEFCKRQGLLNASSNTTFEPDNFFEYIKELAQLPYGGADRYELAVAKAQLLSFYQLNGGFSQLPEFQDGGELVEGDTGNLNFDQLSADDDVEYSSGGGQEEEEENKPQKGSLKRKYNVRDITYPIKKGRSMKELMSETTNTNDDDQRKSTKVAMNATTAAPPPVPKPSFKIGACISRVASQLTGSSSSLLKQQHADPEGPVERSTDEKEASLHDLLSRLRVTAQEPLQEHTIDNGDISFEVIRSFFSDFKNSAVVEQNPELAKKGVGGKRKRPSHLDAESTEAFEFEDMNDSYWTDRVIENGVEDELLPSDGAVSAKRLENHIVPVELKPLKTGRRPYNKRRHQTANHGLGFTTTEKPDYIDPNSPAELVLIFSEFGFFPATEVSLNRMFKRFGPLRESQTELDRDTCRARVVFKKYCDAEVACSSAGRFQIFGPVHVIYQLNYTVSPAFKTTLMVEDGGGEDYIE